MINCTVEFSESGLLKLNPETYEKIGKEIGNKLGAKAHEYIISGKSNCPVCTGNLIYSHYYRETSDGSEVYVGDDYDKNHKGEPARSYWKSVVTEGASGKAYTVGDFQGENHPLAGKVCIARSGPIEYNKNTVNAVVGNNFYPSKTLEIITEQTVKAIVKD